jgi:alkyl hydroperoxide reductase subunit AhpC
MAIRLGDIAPDFTAETTDGPINFHEWKGNGWAVLFSHPKDFTPVCTTELGRVAGLKKEFEKRNAKVIGLSVDPLDSHMKWARDIEDVTGYALNFPLIADHDRKVSDLYDMIHPNADNTMTLIRSLDSLQLTAKYQVATPADWEEGEDVIIGTGLSDEEAMKKFPGFEVKKPYLRVTPQPTR